MVRVSVQENERLWAEEEVDTETTSPYYLYVIEVIPCRLYH